MSKPKTVKDYDKLYSKAESCLKTGIFSLKFTPDFLQATMNFTEAAKGYLSLNLFDKAINAFNRANECSGNQHDSWGQAQAIEEIAKIQIFNKDDFTSGLKTLKTACYYYQVSGKPLVAPRLYIDISNRLNDLQKYKFATSCLQEAFTDSYSSSHDELVKVMLDEIYTKLVNLYCINEQFPLAIDITEKMLKLQLETPKEKKNRITKNYSRLVMLRIILGEEYLCQGIIDKMYEVYDSSVGDDIEDINKLFKAFMKFDKKTFQTTLTYCFELYESSLLKHVNIAAAKRFKMNTYQPEVEEVIVFSAKDLEEVEIDKEKLVEKFENINVESQKDVPVSNQITEENKVEEKVEIEQETKNEVVQNPVSNYAENWR